jgi:DNA primase catalytic core
MTQIPQHEIERIKSTTSLVALLQRQGFDLKKHGKDYVCRCPFHDDKTPSLVVSPDKNLWNCLGACGIGGSVIDWMMQLERVGFRKAVEMLMDEIPSLAAKTVKPLRAKLPHSNLDHQELLHRVVAHYQERLLTSEPAKRYLEKRGLDNDELINHFKIGFCDRKINQILSSRPSNRGKSERLALRETGIVLDNGIERMNGSIVVPIINHSKVLEMYGRKINDVKLRKGAAKHLYLPGQHAGVWNQEGIQNQSEVILCESLIDAMTLWVNGFKNVTTSYGINGFTDELLTVIHSENIERVLIAYDRDEAGDKASNDLIVKLTAEKIEAVRLKLPPKTDINEWALSSDNFSDEFKECVLSAISLLAAKEETVEIKPEPIIKKEQSELEVKTNGDDVLIELGCRHYRVRGLEKNKSHEQLKVNLMIKRGDSFFIDALDLYQAKPRNQFIKQACIECGLEERVIKSDLGKILLKLESIIDEKCQTNEVEQFIELTEEETEQALGLLTDKNLLQRILSDFNQCGVVGEETNKLVGYLGCVSRKLDKPLAIIIQSSSAAGKSSLMDAVLNMMPVEERTQYSAMTGQSLYYLGETNLKNKILAISEEEGAAQASYALKLLQSEGEINIASTGKNTVTGDLETQTYHVEGPVMLFLTTTAIDIDEELLNRCLVLTVNESKAQTEAIHEQQRFSDTLEGLLIKETKNKIITLHHNAQRLLKPLKVVNPFAEQLTFLSDKTRARRDHQKYLTLIKTITLLHQYQREVKSVKHDGEVIQYIEVTVNDINIANQLAHEVLGRTLDELPPQTRKLLQLSLQFVQEHIKKNKLEQKDFRFSRRDIREVTGWGLTQIATHCQRLEAMEYLIAHSGKRGLPMKYELCYEGQGKSGQTFMLGLSNDIHMNSKLSGQKPDKSGSKRPQIGGASDSNRTKKNGAKPKCDVTLDLFNGDELIKSTAMSKSKQHQPSVSI